MKLSEAYSIASQLKFEIEPYCERTALAGSIRRGSLEVKDIEIVVIPKWQTRANPESLFADSVPFNPLYEWAKSTDKVRWIKPGTSEILDWQVKSDGKYWRGLLPEGIKLDMFLTTPDRWAAIYLIRTGSAEFSEAIVTHARRVGKQFADGYLRTGEGEIIPTPDEPSIFAVLRLAYVEPALRINAESLRGI